MQNATLQVSYDTRADILTIEGVRYSGALFREFGGLLASGEMFRLVARGPQEVTLERVDRDRIADGIRHAISRNHIHLPRACSGCQLSAEALEKIEGTT